MPLTTVPLRSKVSEHPHELRISIPAPRNRSEAVVVLLTLIAWSYLGIRLLGAITAKGAWFAVVWLTMWAGSLAIASLSLIRNLFGEDEVAVADGEMRIRKHIFGVGRERTFPTAEIHNLRYIPEWRSVHSRRLSAIAFDSGGKTIRFGKGLAEAEAQHWIEMLQRRSG